MKTVPLTKGYFATIDDEDYEVVSQWKWRALVRAYRFRTIIYACRWERGDKTIMLHRFLMDAPQGTVVDHRDHDGLNNQRVNLRVCTQQENLRNARPKKNAPTGLKGVSRTNTPGRYKSKITVCGRAYNLGTFGTPEDAARAYDEAARSFFGEFAQLNFASEAA